MAQQFDGNDDGDLAGLLEAFEAAPVAMALYEGPDLLLRFRNQQHEELMGRPLPLGESLWKSCPELLTTSCVKMFDNVLTRGKTEQHVNRWHWQQPWHAEPRYVMFSYTFAPWRNARGQVRGVLVTVADLSVQTEAIQQASARDSRLRAMADALPHSIFICSPTGVMRYVNKRWEALTGYTEKTFTKEASLNIVHPEDLPLLRSCWHRRTRDGGSFDVFVRIRHRDAEHYRWQRLMGRCYAERDASDLVWVCSYTDVHKQIVEQEAGIASRRQFVASLSHDIRSPLAGIRATVENMQRKGAVAQPFEDKFNRILRGVERADGMLQSLLEIEYLIGEGGEHLVFSRLNLGELLTESIANYKALHGPRLVVELPNDAEGYWHGPSILRAVDNLLGNAFKYGSEQDPVTVRLRHDARYCAISVHNAGEPISRNDQKRIFGTYQRGASESVQGWGLGLSLVAGVARAHRGKVTVKSTQKLGTTFTLRFPKRKRDLRVGQHTEPMH